MKLYVPPARLRPKSRTRGAGRPFRCRPRPFTGRSTGTLTRSPPDFWGTSPSPCLLPQVSHAGCGLYPAGKASDSIRPTTAPNSRRVRWLWASSSQWWRACSNNRPPAFSNRCCGLVSDQLAIRRGSATLRGRYSVTPRNAVRRSRKQRAVRPGTRNRLGRGRARAAFAASRAPASILQTRA